MPDSHKNQVEANSSSVLKGASDKTKDKFSYKLMDLRTRLLIGFVLVAIFSVSALTYWFNKVALDHEYERVHEKHLIVAQNLSSALSRYTQDVLKTYEFIVDNEDLWSLHKGIPEVLSSFKIRYIAILDNKYAIKTSVLGSGEKNLTLPAKDTLKELALTASELSGKASFSGIQSFDGTPHFFIIRSLPNDLLAIAPVTTDYINALQKSIAFGEKGHSMIVDQYGRVVAHPNAEWQRQSKDASKLSVVQLMIAGKTGVTTFYSPPMKADMIAGYTNVPRTGWGVMVPQPEQELRDHARELIKRGNLISLLSIVFALIFGWWIAGYLTRTIALLTQAAQKLASGEKNIRVVPPSRLAPPDLAILTTAFNDMVDELDQNNKALSKLLVESEAGSKAKTEFLRLMSHEFRTPLTSVIGTLDIMSTADINAELKQLVGLASNSATQLLHILNNVLLLVQLKDGGILPESAPLDIKLLVDEVQNRLQSQAELKQNKLEVCFGTTLTRDVFGDAKIIRQILLCIAEDLISCMNGGELKITVEISSTTGDAQIMTLILEASGMIIPFKKTNSIFESDLKDDQSSSDLKEGMNFGLDVSLQLAHLIDGEITCESAPNQITMLTVKIPVQCLPANNDEH